MFKLNKVGYFEISMRLPRRQLYPKGHKEIAFPRRKGKSKKTAGCL